MREYSKYENKNISYKQNKLQKKQIIKLDQ